MGSPVIPHDYDPDEGWGVVLTMAWRAASRVPWRSEMSLLKAQPKSMMPRVRMTRMGRMMAASTSTAPD